MSDADDTTDESTNDDSGDGGSILENGGIDTDERAGRSLGIEPEAEPDEDTKQEIEEERERRLDPDNRPDGAEVDNTPRTFDVERGQFTDSEDYDDSEPAPFKDPENPNTGDDSSDDSSESSSDDEAGDEPDESSDDETDEGDDQSGEDTDEESS